MLLVKDRRENCFTSNFSCFIKLAIMVVPTVGVEAHGGYSFCGFAALVLLGEEDKIDIQKLLVSFRLIIKKDK